MDSKCGLYGRIFEFNASAESGTRILLYRQDSSQSIDFDVHGSYKIIDGYANRLFHFAYVYEHDKGKVSIYLNGVLQATFARKLPAMKYALSYLGKSSWRTGAVV